MAEATTLELLQRLGRGEAPVIATLGALRGREDLVARALEFARAGNEDARAMALVVLHKAASPVELDAQGAWSHVLDALQDPAPRVRALAARLLAVHTAAGDALERALADPSRSVREAALDGLWEVDRSRALAALEGQLAQASAAGRAALLALVTRRLRRAPLQDNRPIVALALAHLNDGAAAVRQAAAELLGLLPGAATNALIQALQDADERVRLAAVTALLADASAAPTNALTALLKDPSARVRGCALMVLGEGEHREACDAIRPLLADVAVRAAAVRALTKLGCSDAVPDLLALADSGPGPGRAAAIRAVGRLAPGPVVSADPMISRAIDDPDPEVRAAALSACGGAPSMLSRLRRAALEDPVARVRRAALLAISGVPGPDAGGVLLAALDDDDPRVTIVAVEGIAESHVADPTPLLRALTHASAPVRAAVARCLGRLRVQAALPQLRELAQRESIIEVCAAVEWARRHLEPHAFAPLAAGLQRLSDPGGQDVPSTVWYPRGSVARPTEQLVFYLTGVVEAIDTRGDVAVWYATVDQDTLLVRSVDGRAWRLDYSLTTTDQVGAGPGFVLRLSMDPFFGYASADFTAAAMSREESVT